MLDLVLSENKEILSYLEKLGYSSALKAVVFQPRNVADFKKLKFLPDTLVLGSAQDEKLIRRLLEDKRIDGLINIESSTGREHTHYRRSGVNQVIAKIARENGKFYCMDFSRILQTPIYNRYILLGRMVQNIRIFQKYRVPIAIASFASNKYELRNRDALESFVRVLGTRKSVSVETLFKNKQDILSGKIRKGVRVLNF